MAAASFGGQFPAIVARIKRILAFKTKKKGNEFL
jgi:hypothetical protein